MILFNKLPLFRFAVKKQLKRPGIIVDPQAFRESGIFQKFSHWFKNIQTFTDMQRHLSDFHRKKSNAFFISHNNKLLEIIDKRNLRDLELFVSEDHFKQIKNILKNHEPLPTNYGVFKATKATIVQARSFTQTLIRLKSIDQWYQVTVQYQNQQSKQRSYHVLERFYKQKQWKFVRFNL